MKRLIIIFLLLATSCFAQIEGEGLDHGKLGLNKISGGNPGTTAIDSVAYVLGSGSTIADRVKNTYPVLYGFKKLWSGVSDSCLILRRSSDNAELSFGFVNDLLDTASIRTWAGTDTLYVASWHDQSGNYNDAIQTTAGNQPIYNDTLAVRFDGVDDYLTNTMGTFTQPNTFIVTGAFPNIINTKIFASNDGFDREELNPTGSSWRMYAGNTLIYTTNDDMTYISAVFNGASSFGLFDGTKQTGDAGANSIKDLNIGCSYAETFFTNSNYKSFVMSQYGLTETQCNSNTTYLRE